MYIEEPTLERNHTIAKPVIRGLIENIIYKNMKDPTLE